MYLQTLTSIHKWKMHSVSLLYFWFNVWCLFSFCVCCIWLFVLHRVSEREAALESALLMLQEFYLDLEKFLAWLTEAETTANVLQDATHKEKTLEDPQMVRKQWQVSQVLQFRGMSVIQRDIFFSSMQLLNKIEIVMKKKIWLLLTLKCCFVAEI